MTLLLDTCTVLWLVSDRPRLGDERSLIADAEHVHVSVVSLVEITIKIGIGKLTIELAALTDALRADAFQTLPIKAHHLLAQLTLPLLHPDPFDRLLIAQAMTENLAIVSADGQLAVYPIDMIRCG